MTKDELKQIIRDFIRKQNHWDDPVECLTDRILAAIEKEREGEVVLGEGEMVHPYGVAEMGVAFMGTRNKDGYAKSLGKEGQLIFRPAKGNGPLTKKSMVELTDDLGL